MRQIGYLASMAGLAGLTAVGAVFTASAGDPGTPESSAQVTLGGANYFVEGEVLKIDGEQFYVRQAVGGEQVRLIVNRDTNLDCAEVPASRTEGSSVSKTVTSERVSAEEQAPQANRRQLEQGQRENETARGAGFKIGECAFQSGDRVKAEVDDNGRVTTLKYLAGEPPSSPRSIGQSAGTGELAVSKQEKPGQLDMTGAEGYPPGRYAVLPIPRGELRESSGTPFLHKPVKNLQGQQVGTIEDLIMDTKTGRVEYAVILIEGTTHHLHPVPWSAIKLKEDLIPVIDTSKYKLTPDVTLKDAKDLSPDIQYIVKRMETLREREQKQAGQRQPVIKEPAAGGGQGEDEAVGLSGPRALPPGEAPGFEDEKAKR